MPFLLQVMWARPSAISATLPVRFFAPQIDQHQMRVGAAGDDIETAVLQGLGQRLGILDHALGVKLERRPQRLAEGHRLGRDNMHQRAALHAGEHRRIELLRQFLVIGQDRAAARAAQRLVRRGGDDMRMRKRARMRAAGDKAGEMRHVDHQIGADFVGNFAEAAEIDDPRIGRAAGNDHLRPMLFGQPLHLVHVDEVGVAA